MQRHVPNRIATKRTADCIGAGSSIDFSYVVPHRKTQENAVPTSYGMKKQKAPNTFHQRLQTKLFFRVHILRFYFDSSTYFDSALVQPRVGGCLHDWTALRRAGLAESTNQRLELDRKLLHRSPRDLSPSITDVRLIDILLDKYVRTNRHRKQHHTQREDVGLQDAINPILVCSLGVRIFFVAF